MLLVIVSIKIKLYNVINRLSYYKPLLKSLIKYTYLVYLLYVYNKYHYFFFSFFCFRFSFGLSFALVCCSFLPLSFFPLSPISVSPYLIANWIGSFSFGEELAAGFNRADVVPPLCSRFHRCLVANRTHRFQVFIHVALVREFHNHHS